jgi:putative RNA 2'-phosphotransferase
MKERERTRISKLLSLVLRHQPEAIGLELDEAGWVDVESLVEGCATHGKAITREILAEVVATSPKQRFAFSDDGRRIRASQGHSVDVQLGYDPCQPPAQLFHGTVDRFLPAIRERGLTRMQRHHVHLSPDRETATTVGERRGKPIILVIDAGRMARDGFDFFVSANGVWLTEHVPPEYIDFP